MHRRDPDGRERDCSRGNGGCRRSVRRSWSTRTRSAPLGRFGPAWARGCRPWPGGDWPVGRGSSAVCTPASSSSSGRSPAVWCSWRWRSGESAEGSRWKRHTRRSPGGKGDLSSINPTSIVEQQGESSRPVERSGMGTHGTSEPWGRIPRSVGLTRGAAALLRSAADPPSPSHEGSHMGLEEVGCQLIEHHSAAEHRVRSNVAAGDHELANSDPGDG
jgi:hypothetical protein